MIRYARKTDTAHAEIRDGLRQVGREVIDYSGAGNGIWDLLTFRAVTVWVDPKSKGGKLTKGQQEFARLNPDLYFVAPITIDYAIQMCHRAETGRLERGTIYREDGVVLE